MSLHLRLRISIHLPLRGETVPEGWKERVHGFQSISPYGEKPLAFAGDTALLDFNPSPLTGRNPSITAVSPDMSNFNPSPLTGRNSLSLFYCLLFLFQSISPYGEKHLTSFYLTFLYISIHLPLRGETQGLTHIHHMQISIHLPLRGETPDTQYTKGALKFQSISPYGEKRLVFRNIYLILNFNPSPLTGRNILFLNNNSNKEFQSISPYGEKP